MISKNFILNVNSFYKPNFLVKYILQKIIELKFNNDSNRNIPGITQKIY